MDDPAAAVARLAASMVPYVIGVRHHSPVLAAAVPALLDAFAPDLVLLELPQELGEWLPWLSHPDTVAPVALAAVQDSPRSGDPDGSTAFYPFADFSPELAAARWAARNGVEVATCDLPLAHPGWAAPDRSTVYAPEAAPLLADAARSALSGRDGDDLWDRWVEAAAPGSPPDAVRRAALAVGWALRHDAGSGAGVAERDLARESWMRRCVAAAAGRRVAVVVGAFHAPALLDPSGPAEDPVPVLGADLVTSFVPYTFDLLDERSGYPAGIRDPQWQQAVFECAADPSSVEGLAASFAVRITAALRSAGHPAGPAEASEVARLAVDLSRLRGLPAPGRGELVEATQTTLAQGEPVGRGRAAAQAMFDVLVGQRRGRVAPQAPASGLLPSTTRLLAQLRLPVAGQPEQTLRLDPLRSVLDRRRELTLRRLVACSVSYATESAVTGVGGAGALTTSWRAQWSPATEAALHAAGRYGVTLVQAAQGRLRARRQAEIEAGGPTAGQALVGLADAVSCGLPALVDDRLADVAGAVGGTGSLTEIVAGIDLAERLAAGDAIGLDSRPDGLTELLEDLYAAAIRAVDGLAGSTNLDDARSLLALVHRADAAGRLLRLGQGLTRMAATGSPMMQGAAGAVRVILGQAEAGAFGEQLASWVDTTPADLTDRLRGALTVAGPLLEAGDDAVTPLLDRVEQLSDQDFLSRLPGLRGGFSPLTPAARSRLLVMVTDRAGDVDPVLADDPDVLASWLAADLAGRDAVAALGLAPSSGEAEPADVGESGDPADPIAADHASAAAGGVSAAHRWRLILGRQNEALPAGSLRFATALDELYGAGRGEGSYTVDGAGRELAFPSVREWQDELDALFGATVREEVLARAATAGRLDVLQHLDPATVRPSVELLHAVLSLAGGLPEARLARLRPLVARLVAALTAQLARQLRPALTGLSSPRATRRRTGVLDLAGTIRANLRTARPGPDGRVQVIPERPVFRSRARRSVQWQVIVVTDVSGSMEPSTVWAALTASILAGVPALRTRFLTFSTVVVDLTDRLDDPLRLLLEVRVGGGTHIAKALRYTRQLITVPSRTIVVVISDFEEGFAVADLLAEARALVDSGCALLGCASLDDRGVARYNTGVAGRLVGVGMPVAALSPLELARWVGERVR